MPVALPLLGLNLSACLRKITATRRPPREAANKRTYNKAKAERIAMLFSVVRRRDYLGNCLDIRSFYG
jgi:hypothetical protein